ncbi:MAG: hypothetical protein RLZZ535_2758 [Cyanobacteriota bacterium]
MIKKNYIIMALVAGICGYISPYLASLLLPESKFIITNWYSYLLVMIIVFVLFKTVIFLLTKFKILKED